MHYFDSLIAENAPASYVHHIPILSPVSGTRIASHAIPNELIRAGMWGKGMAVSLSGNQVFAPFDGVVEAIPAMGYEVQLVSPAGLRLWIKIGVGTERLLGERCERLVKVRNAVTQGTPLMSFDKRWLKLQQVEPIGVVTIRNLGKIKALVPSHGRQCRAMEDNLFTVYL
ncbi:hypothetical protein CA267_002055 [Alteromonas pelagimontana]|uniref:PTS system glucose-specific EIIA component n=1 Tax=Alteromonas pelagimontana TaxID=1858656 RepID=A0A6M4MBZ6_9ALTE|nr:PTS glucose transporter subunit IIA [Alteromonas pelagimontana]QJR79666.1 hypothetical protein CA267_002055 [Alteromonas pelagimontana]